MNTWPNQRLNALKWILLPGLAVFVSDQILKIYTAKELMPNQMFSLLNQGWLHWTRAPNSGVVFQSLEMLYNPENALWTRYVPAFCLLLLGWLILRGLFKNKYSSSGRVSLVGCSLFWFGGLSNVLSHFNSLFVDDTLSMKFFPGNRTFTFNIADMGIAFGMTLLGIALMNMTTRQVTLGGLKQFT